MNTDIVDIDNTTTSDEDDIYNSAEDEETDDTDPEHLQYLQDQFQDDLVNEIFENIVDYIRDSALPLCEFMTTDDVEVVIDELQSCES